MTRDEALSLAFEKAIALLTKPIAVRRPYTFTQEQREYMQAMRDEMLVACDRARMLVMLCEDHMTRIDQVLAGEDDGA